MILGGGTVDRTTISRSAHGVTVHVPYVSLAATDGEHKVVIDTGAYEVDTVKKPWAHRYPEEELDAVLASMSDWMPGEPMESTVRVTARLAEDRPARRRAAEAQTSVPVAEKESPAPSRKPARRKKSETLAEEGKAGEGISAKSRRKSARAASAVGAGEDFVESSDAPSAEKRVSSAKRFLRSAADIIFGGEED